MGFNIVGIQQMGIGVEDVNVGFKWYRENFGMDIEIFNEKAVAEYMLHYTDNKPRERHAILALNMMGGGGFEIWQHTGKTPEKVGFDVKLGDVGINICKIKTPDALSSYDEMKSKGVKLITDITETPNGKKTFFVNDPYKNVFQFVEEKVVFSKGRTNNGGVYGAVIGVSDIDKSLKIYKDILGYDKVVFDKTNTFTDLHHIPGGEGKFRRVLLAHSKSRIGGFADLFGPTQIELIQTLDREPKNIYKDRIWGDPGFIHLCFDIVGFNDLRETCKEEGFSFTVDSTIQIDGGKSFDMGKAAGHFGYISDPDGIPIEFVETHKIPVIEKLGVFINLDKRGKHKKLPGWILNALRFKRVK